MLGKSFRTAPGGKGANQAVQAARLGADVTMVGKVGGDSFGRELIASAQAAGIHTQHILQDPDNPSAIGNILLEVAEGQKSKNRIIVVSGANMAITPDDVAFVRDIVSEFDMVMLQLEIPMQINELVAQYAFEKGVPVMPVSYTHLDVYKRQVLQRPHHHRPPLLRRFNAYPYIHFK